ncbi:MAG: thioredoxin-disulfide reductase [Clostridium sp.]
MYDVIIIGSGPAGLSAAIYGKSKFDTLIIEEKPMSGGQIVNTSEVDNYPGLPGVGGFELAQKMREHAKKSGVTFAKEQAVSVEDKQEKKLVTTNQKQYEAKAVIIASGASYRKLGVPGEERLTGMGVSYCATCDGAFFRNRTVAVAGGGDVALEDALFLARGCEKVYLIHRRDSFRGAKVLAEQVQTNKKIEILYDTVVEEICGEGMVEKIKILNKKTQEEKMLPVNGIFVAVGMVPNTVKVIPDLALDDTGYIKAGEDGRSSVPGIYAVGDVRTKQLRQVVTAVADGANAIASMESDGAIS